MSGLRPFRIINFRLFFVLVLVLSKAPVFGQSGGSLSGSAPDSGSITLNTSTNWDQFLYRDINDTIYSLDEDIRIEAPSYHKREIFNRKDRTGSATYLDANYIRHLSEGIKFETVTVPSEMSAEKNAYSEFLKFHEYLYNQFPLVHCNLDREVVGGYSLLYHWKGRRSDLKPVLLIAHMDVVPVDNPNNWSHNAFSGIVDSGFVWGRGTMDDKVSVLALLETIESLLKSGYTPRRDIYLAFGHDEETEGSGAAAISRLLAESGIRFEYVLDEGGGIAEGMVPGVKDPFAFVSIAEKGYVTLRLSVKNEKGGHSSAPSERSVVGILSKAICNLEDHPFPTRITGPVRQMLRITGRKMAPLQRFAATHSKLFERLIKNKLDDEPITSSLLRTTTATTMIQGGFKENVMPSTAQATVNFRILPGENIKSVVRRVNRIIHDPLVEITVMPGANEPPKVTSTRSESYRILKRTIEQVFTDVTVSPSLSISGSDSRFYENITDNILRFTPLRVTTADAKRIHGANERISVTDYYNTIRFYYSFIVNTDRHLGFMVMK